MAAAVAVDVAKVSNERRGVCLRSMRTNTSFFLAFFRIASKLKITYRRRKMMEFIQADLSHLDFLLQLEMDNFKPERRSDKKSIKNSILSKNQIVFIASDQKKLVASATIFLYKMSLRVYSLAVCKEEQGKGYGRALMRHIIDYARLGNFGKISLEADCTNQSLMKFYNALGFQVNKRMPSYYGENEDGVRMYLDLGTEPRNVVITDFATDFFDDMENVICIRAQQYIENPRYQVMKNMRVFNFCKSLKYQSVGYYISLLGYARNHKVYPSTSTMRDFKSRSITKSIGDEVYDQIQEALEELDTDRLVLDTYFGYASDLKYQGLVEIVSELFEAPITRFEFRKNLRWELYKAYALQLSDVMEIEGIKDMAREYFVQKRFRTSKLHIYEYDLAILVDKYEANPPSDRIALQNFKKAAEKYGFYVEFITKKDYKRIAEFDALFIRTTTNVNDYTYDFSRYAYSEGLIVIDDPWSILGCSNKLFLYEKMKLNDIKMPETWLLNKKGNYTEKISELSYPVILKQPDSAFSKGVHKVTNEEELKERLSILFKTSEIVIAQQYIPSEYDWRIGVLNGKPLFACKYFMAKGHWQIYNWDETSEQTEGDSITIPIEEAPQDVVNMAVKASLLMGDGLYGVDLKEVNHDIYVIEVNDNPSIDAGIEDAVLKTELYDMIMREFSMRIENSRNLERFVSN